MKITLREMFLFSEGRKQTTYRNFAVRNPEIAKDLEDGLDALGSSSQRSKIHPDDVVIENDNGSVEVWGGPNTGVEIYDPRSGHWGNSDYMGDSEVDSITGVKDWHNKAAPINPDDDVEDL